MTSIKKLKQFIKNASVNSNPEMNQKVLSELLREIPDRPNLWSIVIKKYLPITLGLAAAIVIISVILYVTRNPGQNPNQEIVKPTPPPIVIPQELVDMSIEELLALHYNPENSTYDPNLIQAALTQALNKMDSSQVMSVARTFKGLNAPQVTGRGGRGGMTVASERVGGFGGTPGREYPVTVNIDEYNWIPVYNFLVNIHPSGDMVQENANLFVNARLLNVTINVDDIRQALVKKWQIRTEWMDEKYRAEVRLEVIDTTPQNAIKKGEIINVPILIEKGQLESLKIGGQYYIGMLQSENRLEFLPYLRGVFEVKTSDETDLLATRFWLLLCDTQDILLFGNTPKQETVAYWVSLLDSESYEMALTYFKIMPKKLIPGEIIRDTIVQRLLNEDTYEKTFDYLAMLPDELIPAQEIVDVIEQRYESHLAGLRQNNTRTDTFNIEKISRLLISSGDKNSIKRMVDLLEQDGQGNENNIFWSSNLYTRTNSRPFAIQLLVALEKDNPGNLFKNTYEMYKNNPLITKVYEYPIEFINDLLIVIFEQFEEPVDEDSYAILLDMIEEPSAYGIDIIDKYNNNAKLFQKLWTILGTSGDFDIQSYLKNFFANPDLSSIGVSNNPAFGYPSYANHQLDFERAACEVLLDLPADKQLSHQEQLDILLTFFARYKDDTYFVVGQLRDIIWKNDVDAIPLISELLLNAKALYWDIVRIISTYIPDQAFVPVIKEALAREFDEDLLNLLITLGDTDGALSIARQQTDISGSVLNTLFLGGDEDTAIKLAQERLDSPIRIANYNNRRQDMRLFIEIISLLGRSGRQELVRFVERYTDAEYVKNISPSDFSDFQEAAIIALAKLGGSEAIERLRYIYQTSEEVYVRHTAALALYYLGDDTGWPIIEPLIKKTDIDYYEVAGHFSSPFTTGRSPIWKMLGSDRIDALFIEKIKNYIDQNDDFILFRDPGNNDDTTEFFEKYKSEIFQVLLDNLSNPSAIVRSKSIEFLRKATGQNFGFDPRKQSPQQEIIQQWRDYIESEY